MFSSSRSRVIAWGIVYICATAIILGVIATIVSTRELAAEVRNTQLEGTPTGRKLLDASERILDCTDAGDEKAGRPPGRCFKESQQRTADAVGNINRVAVLAAACAAGLPDGMSDQQRVIRVQDCLIKQLAVEEP
jgi:hypothetical protein